MQLDISTGGFNGLKGFDSPVLPVNAMCRGSHFGLKLSGEYCGVKPTGRGLKQNVNMKDRSNKKF